MSESLEDIVICTKNYLPTSVSEGQEAPLLHPHEGWEWVITKTLGSR